MATRLTDEQIGRALAIADIFGVQQTANRYGVSPVTLKRYYKKTLESPGLDFHYRDSKAKLAAKWTEEVGQTIICGATKLREMIEDEQSDIGRMSAITMALKVLGEIQVSAIAVGGISDEFSFN